LLDSIEIHAPHDDVLRAQALDLVGERDAAFGLLEHRTAEEPNGPTLDPLLQGLFAVGNVDRALTVASLYRERGNLHALAQFARSLFEAGRFSFAAGLFLALYNRTGESSYAYETARSKAKIGDHDGTLSFLECAVQAGLPLERLHAEVADFASVQNDPRFVRMQTGGSQLAL